MPADDAPAWMSRVVSAVRSVRYGAVELVIHEGRIVQIETREKIRIAPPDHADRAAGRSPHD